MLRNNVRMPQSQSGAVLLVSLVMLLLLTIIGMSAVNMTTLDTRISANSRDRNMAFDAAETALNVASHNISPGNDLPNTTSTAGFMASALSSSWWKTADSTWWATNSNQITDFNGRTNSTNGIGYVIEQPISVSTNGAGQQVADLTMGGIKPETRFYRITSRGVGPGGSDVHLQTVYARKKYTNAVE
ncbi:MAG: hypothetical protein CL581_10470 [Alteromonadaceae bacterium]|nr:hypothetical protein [Alteromonadaceae bacterium]MBH86774.1 hypothetical protein [Alteromonadaceae bacterium]|tara:strand:+ start:56493 stop:57053 length:561 start_codon:yes stop_codon:yes gene_type:complete